MPGTFTIGLLEVLAHLIPGGLVLAAAVYTFIPAQVVSLQQALWQQVCFIAAAYVVGHVVNALSLGVLVARQLLRKMRQRSPREQRLRFYGELRADLYRLFGTDITREDEYLLSLRLVENNLLRTGQEVERLYSLTVFSRNMCVALVAAGLLIVLAVPALSALCLALAPVFFVRYDHLEGVMTDTVFRAAFVVTRTHGATQPAGAASAGPAIRTSGDREPGHGLPYDTPDREVPAHD